MKIYGFFDVVAKRIRGVTIAENDGLVIRENARALAQVYPLGDIKIKVLAELDEQTGAITRKYDLDEQQIVDWNSYKFPESPIKQIKKVDKVEEETQK